MPPGQVAQREHLMCEHHQCSVLVLDTVLFLSISLSALSPKYLLKNAQDGRHGPPTPM